ncbi:MULTISPECIES: phage holin family protein [unclassified Candidatus Frackibacter]|uniref:phage holin family protein n=1 Tax=unclassified Candidatus Frackibacter TaxID=2648818 RepID=UPI00088D862A|nr:MULTISPECIES: phage holin family protein [unclassified Candidatus Frackibacter]SDC73619.1 4 TMS phage holin, superfamily IV [Candidatus Frackibacter sp. WG11]SEM87760.1 4 TMS phage holin, superfamily IV [Candidatus Frackibacter sp. WG12]SFL96955.1 4 TMS phage holin, superfamily IV [Candidatus Frackibacter sp. WG13]
MQGWLGAIVRFIVSAFVLLAVGYFLPGFEIVGFTNALIAAIVIAVIGYAIEAVLGEDISPQSRGIIGFVTSATVIYFTQFVVANMAVTIVGALLAALVIGIVDAFVPTELR